MKRKKYKFNSSVLEKFFDEPNVSLIMRQNWLGGAEEEVVCTDVGRNEETGETFYFLTRVGNGMAGSIVANITPTGKCGKYPYELAFELILPVEYGAVFEDLEEI